MERPVEANSTGGQGSGRAVAPIDDDDDDDDDDDVSKMDRSFEKWGIITVNEKKYHTYNKEKESYVDRLFLEKNCILKHVNGRKEERRGDRSDEKTRKKT